MAGLFDEKHFNAEVFARYMETIPRLKQNQFIKNGVLRARSDLKAMLPAQTGGNLVSVPIFGTIDGTALNYDGSTNITATSMKTFLQQIIVVGRAKAWIERDFSADITGADFMAEVAKQVAAYYEEVDQKDILAILTGIFAMNSNNFSSDHTLDITGTATPTVGATTLNDAIQKAGGANKGIFNMVIMHSYIESQLENNNLLNFSKYTDSQGIQRDTILRTWNGRTVLIDDDLASESGYYASTSSATGALKVVASGASTGEINLATVTAADFYPTGVAANDYVVAGVRYTTYVLGDGAFEYADVGAKVPYEMKRDALTHGGEDYLVTRQRKVFAPRGISWKMPSPAVVSPTVANLKSGSNWIMVNDSNASSKTYYPSKNVPIARILSRG